MILLVHKSRSVNLKTVSKITTTILHALKSTLFFCLLLAGPFFSVRAEPIYSFLSNPIDNDTDGLSEFVSLEVASLQDDFPALINYYEMDEQGQQISLWSYLSESPVTSCLLTDVNGDQFIDIIVTLRTSSHPLLIFKWSNNTFPSAPSLSWSPSTKQMNSTVSGAAMLDLTNDGIDELVVAVGSPTRDIHVLSLDGEKSIRPLMKLSSPITREGYGAIYLSSLDINNDSETDLVATSPDLRSLRVNVFLNKTGTLAFAQGNSFPSTKLGASPTALRSFDILTIDSDNDGAANLFIPFENKKGIALHFSEEKITFQPTSPSIVETLTIPKTQMASAEVNLFLLSRTKLILDTMGVTKIAQEIQETTQEVSAEQALSALHKIERVVLKPIDEAKEEAPAETPPIVSIETAEEKVSSEQAEELQVVDSEEPSLSETGEESSESMVADSDSTPQALEQLQAASEEISPITKEASQEIVSIEKTETSEAGPTLEEARAESPKKVQKLELVAVEPSSSANKPVVLPEGALISDSLEVGVIHSWPLDQSPSKKMVGFTPHRLPDGARFDPATRSIQWTPTANQTGIHKLSYTVDYTVTTQSAVQETEETVQIVDAKSSEQIVKFVFVRVPIGEAKPD